MEIAVSKTKLNEIKSREGVECLRGDNLCLSIGRKNVNTDLLLQNLTLSQKGREIMPNLQPYASQANQLKVCSARLEI